MKSVQRLPPVENKIMFSQNIIFHDQVKKFFTSLKSHFPSLKYAALFLGISWNLKPNLKSARS